MTQINIGSDLILARLFDESGHRELGDKVRADIWRLSQPTHREALEAQRQAGDIQDEDTYEIGGPRRRPRRDCTAYPRQLLEAAARLPSARDERTIQEAIGREETEEAITNMVASHSRAAVRERFHPSGADPTLPLERYDIERLINVYMSHRVVFPSNVKGARVPVITKLRSLWKLMSPI